MRAVILAVAVIMSACGDPPARAGSASDGLTCRIIRRGAEFARTRNPQANTGEGIDIVRHVADVLAGFVERLAPTAPPSIRRSARQDTCAW